MALDEELKQETEKWLQRIKSEREKITLIDKNKENFLNNIDSYVADSEHFLANGDLIRAFEAVIWAFAWMEIGKELGIIR